MGTVEGERQAFGLHGENRQLICRIFAGALLESLCHPFFNRQHPSPRSLRHGRFAMSKAMEELQCRRFVTPGQLKSFGIICCQVTSLEALHQKCHDGCDRDRVKAVIIAVPVRLHDELGAPDAEV